MARLTNFNQGSSLNRNSSFLHSMGFSLIEILIAVSIGLVLVGFTLTIFSNNKKANINNIRLIELNDNIRFAMTLLKSDLNNAGFYGGTTRYDSIKIKSNFSITGCNYSSNAINFATATDYPIWGAQAANDPEINCLAGISAGTDYISLRGSRSITTSDSTLNPNNVYVRSNGNEAEFIADGLSSNLSNSTDMNWQYYSNIYYICEHRLIRQSLVYDTTTNKSTWDTNVVIGPEISGTCDSADSHTDAGVDNLQISYGVDNTNDGVVDYFTDTISGTDKSVWNNVIEVKIFMLVRSAQDFSYSDSKNYKIGGTAYTPSGSDVNYHRKIFSTTIFLRNAWYDALNNS